MRRFARKELSAFLGEIDRHLGEDATIVVIGGAAISLGFSGSHATQDIDLWPQFQSHAFWDAVEACRKSPDAVPVERVGVASPPYDFEDRLWLLRGEFGRLRVLIPEAHDLALLKVSRAYEHDLQGVEDVHGASPLDLETLVERYHETLTQVIGPPSRFRLNMLAMVARLFGEATAQQLEARI